MDVNVTIPENNQLDSLTSKRNKLSVYFVEFCNRTSVHGFKYLAENKRPRVEKIWWMLVLCGCIYMCGSLVSSTFKKWDENPILTTFGQRPMHLWDIPFPAVTICSEVKIKKSMYNMQNAFNHRKTNNWGVKEWNKLMDIMMFCGRNSSSFKRRLPTSRHLVDSKTISTLLKYVPSLSDVINHTEPSEYTKLFSPSLTNLGECYTFNMIDKTELFHDITYVNENHSVHQQSSYWTIDDNYIKTKNYTIPIRATGISDNLFLSLHTLVHDKNEHCNTEEGYSVILHHPADYPTLSLRQTVPIALNSNYKILIKPEITITSKYLTKYDPHRRHCFYSTERSLKFFKTYTKHNCKLECIANYTLSECNCVPYSLPHESSTKICSLADAECASHCQDLVLHMDMDVENDELKPIILKACDCLPLCTLINYNTQVHQYKQVHVSKQANLRSEIEIGYKETEFPIMKRQELFSNADFWASCGGLMGLFTGFSVVSLAEIVYYISIRWICNLWCLGEGFFQKK